MAGLSGRRSAVAFVALGVTALAPGMLVAVITLALPGAQPRWAALSQAFTGVMLAGPPAGLILGVSALLLRPRRHYWAAIVATCISAAMLVFTGIFLYQIFG